MSQNVEPESAAPETAGVRLEKELVRKASIVAQQRGITIREVLTPHLLKPVQREYERVVAEMNAELGTPAGA